jgi:hypothetical protein
MKFHSVLAASALALGVAVGAAPVKASTVTDTISFADTGTYATNGDPVYGYNGSAVAKGYFNITFDPTQLYLAQSISGFISDLTDSVTDNSFTPALLTLAPITLFAYDGGTLTLYSETPTLANGNGTNLAGTDNITISFNGLEVTPPNPLASSVWYSQPTFQGTAFLDTLTTTGVTPLPSTWTMLLAGFVGLAFFAYRGSQKGSAAFAAA